MITKVLHIRGVQYVICGDDKFPREEYYCKSTDPKPEDAQNAALLYEFDTQRVFMFDADDKKWIEQ